ncbi:lectin, mannose-binding 2-like b [Corythoichthys intestinalis]|uniref:lectin, mannose-binding 2-like b n=1 Tax=Corythoichthys intestinalis TaxID=161448 RepID=UPI0025A67572|nr:lectin, mannose-binding 2-like b [Corythoichthys intestinalis]XP_061804170.1 VIP36-like protein [Nerophis lumbriciformis]
MYLLKDTRQLICLLGVLCILRLSKTEDKEFLEEFFKREYSLVKPYSGLSFSSSPTWDLKGTAMLTTDYLRLTPDQPARQGAVWSRVPLILKEWELKVHFKIHGQARIFMSGDGLAIWLTKERMQDGPVFGSKNLFTGLGIFVDTYLNSGKKADRSVPYISVMLGNGTLSYDHDRDGIPTELGGCPAMARNARHETFLLIRYSKNTLTVMFDDGQQTWKDCTSISGLHLPRGYYLGASSATGDLSDNHDIISMKLYELTVEEEPNDEPTIPRVDNMKQFQVKIEEEQMSAVQLFFGLLFTILGLGVLAVVGLIGYGRWKQNKRKHFY